MMEQGLEAKLCLGRKLALAAVGIAAVAASLSFGLLNAPRVRAQSTQTTAASLPSFEVASIKPNRSGRHAHWDQVSARQVHHNRRDGKATHRACVQR